MAFESSAQIFTSAFSDAVNGIIRVIVSDNADATNGPYQLFVSVWGPDGAEIYVSAEEVGTPEISFAASGNGAFVVALPYDSDNNYYPGVYKVRVRIYDEDTAAFVDLQETEATFIPNVKHGETITDDLDFRASIDCRTGVITVIDATPMTGWNADVIGSWRTVTIAPPPTAQDPTPTVYTETSNDIVAEPIEYQLTYGVNSFSPAIYVVALSINRVKPLAETTLTGATIQFTQSELIGKTINLEVNCDTSACDIAACMEEEFDTLNALACNGAGWGQLTNAQKARFEYASNLYLLAVAYDVLCDNQNKAGEKIDQLKEFLNCGCGCDDTDQPMPYNPPGA